jgi:hypothetical protein
MSDEISDDTGIVVDGEKVTLGDLMGVNLDEVKELRGSSFPKGNFSWEVDGGENAPKVLVVGEGDKAKGAVAIALKCIEVINVNDPEFDGDQNALIGKIHRETFFLTTVEGLGYMKAFFKDIGAPYASNVKDLLANSVGTRFNAPIGKRKDKDDADKIYTNVVRNKIKPLGEAAKSDLKLAG